MSRVYAARELDAAATPDPGSAPQPAAAPRRRASVLYVLSFVPTYVQWEMRELMRRGVPVSVVLPAAWPRAAMWDHITGFDRHAPDGPAVRVADFHGWLAQPARALARPAALLLARVWRRRARVALPLAARCVREGTVRQYLAAAWLAEVSTGGDAPAIDRISRVHSHFATDAAYVGSLLAQLLGVPFSVTTHANDIFVPRVPRRLPRLLARAAQVFTISHFNRAHLEAVAGTGIARRVRVLHLGVDVDALPRWSPAAQVFTIVCTASGLGEKKGVAVLLDACAMLKARGFRFRCQICGADPGERRLSELRRLVRERGLADKLSLVGALAWTATQQRVAQADVFVLPSIRTAQGDMDGIPVSLIEAMGIGVPVIASRLSGIPELIEDGRNGWLIPAGDAGALADAIERVASDAALARAMAGRARRRVLDAFSLQRAVDGLLEAWDEPASSDPRAERRTG